jgi:hypothetical protein
LLFFFLDFLGFFFLAVLSLCAAFLAFLFRCLSFSAAFVALSSQEPSSLESDEDELLI